MDLKEELESRGVSARGDGEYLIGDGWIAQEGDHGYDVTIVGASPEDAASAIGAAIGTETCTVGGYYRNAGLFEYATECGEVMWHNGAPERCSRCGRKLVVE